MNHCCIFLHLIELLATFKFCALPLSLSQPSQGALKILILHVRCVNDHGFQEMAYSLMIKLGGRANECQGPICLVGSLSQPLFMACCPYGTAHCPHACLYLLSFLSVVHPYILSLEDRAMESLTWGWQNIKCHQTN